MKLSRFPDQPGCMGQGPYRNWPVVGCHAAELGASYQHSARAEIRCTKRCEHARRASTNDEDVYHLWLSQTMNETCPPSMAIQCREVAERFDTWQEKVGAALYSGEGWQAGDFLTDRTLGDLKFKGTVLIANNGVAFVTKFVKVRPVGPNVL